tara:strand:+ start:167 stop:646 length:480 start_codon:yes stop_codon:yes gene_type:complete
MAIFKKGITQAQKTKSIIIILSLFLSTQSMAKDLKNNFYEYSQKYLDAEDVCKDRLGGTFKTNYMIFLNMQKCIYKEDKRLIQIYMSGVPAVFKNQMYELMHERHLDLFEAARTLSFAANRCESNSCVLPALRAYVDFTDSIQQRYFNKQQKIINKIYK